MTITTHGAATAKKHSSSNNDLIIGLNPFRAILIWAGLLAFIIYGLAVCRPIPNLYGGRANGEDLKCYQAIVAKIHAGENYYSAAGYELRRMGYATASVFNWRLPLLAWFLGKLPSPIIGRATIFLLALLLLYLWLKVFQQNEFSPGQIVFGGLLLAGPLIYSVIPGPFLMHEFWAGTLILLSLALYAHRWHNTSVLVGLTALFLRELALPFVLVMLVLALVDRRRREAMLWFCGILIFGVEFLFHWTLVTRLITENDKVLQGGWIAFGGWPFVLNTAQMHPFLVLAPAWMTAVVVPISLLGLLGQRSDWGTRLTCTILVYMLAFAVVGRPFNAYWGLMYAFLVPIGLVQAPRVISRLFKPFKAATIH